MFTQPLQAWSLRPCQSFLMALYFALRVFWHSWMNVDVTVTELDDVDEQKMLAWCFLCESIHGKRVEYTEDNFPSLVRLRCKI